MSVNYNSGFKIFSWNVGGARSNAFSRSLRLALQLHRPDFVILLEPQISGEVANKVCEKLGYPDVIQVEANGRSGGIWLFWNAKNFGISIDSAGSQHLTLSVLKDNNRRWKLTAMYASPRQQFQKLLWKCLIEESKNIEYPWVLTGDFNAILSPFETTGQTTTRTLRRCKRFGDWINEAELVDLGFSGPNQTWCRGGQVQTYRASRLDRSLCNMEWNKVFPNTTVVHLARLSSDHNPILTTVPTQGATHPSSKHFNFEAAWLTHADFQKFLNDNWNGQNLNLPSALQEFSDRLQSWSKLVFGSVFQRKKRLVARIEGIERKLALSFHPGLAKLHTKLAAELEKTMEHEELYWFQRARESWVKYSERNTTYFHQIANIRRRLNIIECLKNVDGEWIRDIQKLAKLVFDFFSNLYLQ
ncbi:unnamed protein product [Linum trigynum]|uniref:Endonuclease/exonuclease/phosphatase domain-containing protein n=1 Tax=Linum trigynum TaxID=586398 RepID=A0AAV2DCM5_9ROSI